MTDNFIRHFIAFAGTLVVLLAYIGGYLSSSNGWWWSAFSIIIIYVALYKLIDV